MRVMGLDPSTKFGVAVVDSGEKIVFTQELEFKKLTGFDRVNSLIASVEELRTTYKPDLIVVEALFVGMASSAITLIQLGSILRYFFWQEGILYVDVPASVLKKFVSGRGDAKKEQMMMHVLRRWGHEPKTNNIADAIGLAMAGLCCAGEEFPAYSVDSLKGVRADYADLLSQFKK